MYSSELSLKMPNLQTLITNTFFKQHLSSSNAPSLQRVVYSPAYGSDFNYQENLTHTDVPHVGFMVDCRDSLFLESLILPPTLETLLLYRVQATRLSFAPSESLKELYLRDFPVFRRQELSLAELFPSLEVLYFNAWSAAPWTDRDILGWFIDAKGNPVPLPPNLKVVFTDLPDVINFLKREHPQVKIVPITKQNTEVEAMYVHLLRLERLHGLDLRAPKLL